MQGVVFSYNIRKQRSHYFKCKYRYLHFKVISSLFKIESYVYASACAKVAQIKK